MVDTNKKEIKCTFAYLTINNLNLDRNFRFKVIRSSQSLVQTASVSINRNYFDAHKTTVQKGDKIYISIQNNKEEKVLIFQGVVNDVSMTPAEISLTAFYKVVDNEVFNETYKDTKLEKVLSMIAPKIKYEAQDKEYSQLIARGTKLESLSRFLNQKSFFVDLKMNLVVRDNPKNGTTYIIDECLFRTKSDEIIIFPIPQLDIQDIVEYQGQKFIVVGIVYHYLSKSMMILDVVPYKGIEKAEFIIEEIPEDERSKPIDEACLYFENPNKLLELSEGARNHIVYMAKQVKKEMDAEGQKFVPFYITEAHRTVAGQTHILSRKMRLLSGTQNMFEYYRSQITSEENIGDSSSLNYLNALQAYFDGVDPDNRRWARVHEDHQQEIEAMGLFPNTEDSMIEVVNHKGDKEWKTPRTLEAENLMAKYMDRYVFRPSRHMDDKGTGYLIDLRIKEDTGELGGDTEKTADRLFAKNKTYYSSCANTSEGKKCEAGYKTKTKGEPHIHLKLLKNYTPKN